MKRQQNWSPDSFTVPTLKSYDKKEIDQVQDSKGKLSGFEIKWQNKGTKAPKDWRTGYPDAGFQVIYSANYLEFIQ